MQGHTGSVRSVSFNHDGSMLATGSLDGTAKLWSIPDGQIMKTLTVS
jgi:WD40 repeat protein